jgi:hypothetical protein
MESLNPSVKYSKERASGIALIPSISGCAIGFRLAITAGQAHVWGPGGSSTFPFLLPPGMEWLLCV